MLQSQHIVAIVVVGSMVIVQQLKEELLGVATVMAKQPEFVGRYRALETNMMKGIVQSMLTISAHTWSSTGYVE